MIATRTWLAIASILVTALLYLVLRSSTIENATAAFVLQTSLLLIDMVVIGFGAGWLVDGASRLAGRLGISELVVGLTIVAFGTSAPEIAASMVAGFEGNGDISIANIVGSNVFNLCIILGLVTLLKPGGLAVEHALVTRDGPVLIAGTILLLLFVGGLSTEASSDASGLFILDFTLQRIEGIAMTGVLVFYLWWIYRSSRRDNETAENPSTKRAYATAWYADVALILLGLIIVVQGCNILVGWAADTESGIAGVGALWFAQMLEIPDHLVGVTIVAAGTSAPELVVSVTAVLRGARGISTGNLLGSATFNALGVLGLTGIFVQSPLADSVVISAAMLPSMFALLLLMVVAVAFMWTHRRIHRWEGAVLLLLGVGYWVYDFAVSR